MSRCVSLAYGNSLFICRMNFLSNILREEGGFEYKRAIVDSIVTIIRDIPDAKENGLLHLCEFIEDCEFTYLSTQVICFSPSSTWVCICLCFHCYLNISFCVDPSFPGN